MTKYIDKTEAMRRFEPFGREIPKDQVMSVIARVPTTDRPTDGDLISRAEAIEALGEEPPVWCDEEYEIAERSQWRADVEAIKSVPSADTPRPIDPTIKVDLESGVVPRSACEPKEPKTIIYADRPTDEFDGMILSTDKYMAFIDKKEIHIMRKDAHKVTIERAFDTKEDDK